MRVSPAGAAPVAMASSDWLRDGGRVGASALRPTSPPRPSRLDGAPYVDKVATVRRAAAVDFEA
jgi:hypothetical protein